MIKELKSSPWQHSGSTSSFDEQCEHFQQNFLCFTIFCSFSILKHFWWLGEYYGHNIHFPFALLDYASSISHSWRGTTMMPPSSPRHGVTSTWNRGSSTRANLLGFSTLSNYLLEVASLHKPHICMVPFSISAKAFFLWWQAISNGILPE